MQERTSATSGPGDRTSDRARRFIDALRRAEDARDPGPLVELFAEDCELQSLAVASPMTGRDGARRFWSAYLSSFAVVRSRFDRVTEADGLAVLEWTTTVKLGSGDEAAYRGVTIVEFTGDAVRRFRTYYDSAALERRARRP